MTSHPSRVRGLKYIKGTHRAFIEAVAPFAGAWIEIEELQNELDKITKSHPSRVRGLKFVDNHVFLSRDYVAPFAGAWIEIKVSETLFQLPSSHPSRVRGLK